MCVFAHIFEEFVAFSHIFEGGFHMSYTAHELAKKLLELPDVDIFIQTDDKGLKHIKDAFLCSCEAEAIITHEDY